jgi:hypothetical protein
MTLSDSATSTPRAHRRRLVIGALAGLLAIATYAVWEYSRRVCCAPAPLPELTHVAADPPSPRPADFALDIAGQTGTVSPRYFYRYRLHIAGSGLSRYTFMPGYSDTGTQWASDFHTTAAQLDFLWSEFQSSGLRHTPPPPQTRPEQMRVGGGRTLVTVRASGQSFTLDPDRADVWAASVGTFVQHASAVVPDSIHARMGERHSVWSDSAFGVESRR